MKTMRAYSFFQIMVFAFAKRISANVQRRIRRALLAEPEKTPQRIAVVMASVVLLSIVITYNALFEREKRKQGCSLESYQIVSSICFV